MYSSQVLDHFERPRNAGVLAAPDAVAQIENPACGDVLQLMLKVTRGQIEERRIEEIRFRARGCVASMACASALTELVRGKSLSQARALQRDVLLQALGGLPPASAHASHLAMDALQAALDKLSAK